MPDGSSSDAPVTRPGPSLPSSLVGAPPLGLILSDLFRVEASPNEAPTQHSSRSAHRTDGLFPEVRLSIHRAEEARLERELRGPVLQSVRQTTIHDEPLC